MLKYELDRSGSLLDVLDSYRSAMKTRFYNLRILGDKKARSKAFDAFLDAYSSSLDVYPICHRTPHRRSVEALWEDFVTVAHDTNLTAKKLREEHAAHDDRK